MLKVRCVNFADISLAQGLVVVVPLFFLVQGCAREDLSAAHKEKQKAGGETSTQQAGVGDDFSLSCDADIIGADKPESLVKCKVSQGEDSKKFQDAGKVQIKIIVRNGDNVIEHTILPATDNYSFSFSAPLLEFNRIAIDTTFFKESNAADGIISHKTHRLDDVAKQPNNEIISETQPNSAPANGAPANGAPANGAPANSAPANGAPANSAPANGAPANGAPANGVSSAGAPIWGMYGPGSIINQFYVWKAESTVTDYRAHAFSPRNNRPNLGSITVLGARDFGAQTVGQKVIREIRIESNEQVEIGINIQLTQSIGTGFRIVKTRILPGRDEADRCSANRKISHGRPCFLDIEFSPTATTLYLGNLSVGPTRQVTGLKYVSSPLIGRGSNPPPSQTNLDIVCGAQGNGCYDNQQAMAAGRARLPDGTTIELINAAGGFKVWKELNGSGRILNANGTNWQRKLNRAGLEFASELTESDVISQIAGRACPPNVFLNHGRPTETGRCLYYDSSYSIHAVATQNGAGKEGEDWLHNWDSPGSGKGVSMSYFEGNIAICADKGMRLPTIYETTAKSLNTTANTNAAGIDNITPIFAGASTGVPSIGAGWVRTASAINLGANVRKTIYRHWWGNTSGYDTFYDYWANMWVQCVLP